MSAAEESIEAEEEDAQKGPRLILPFPFSSVFCWVRASAIRPPKSGESEGRTREREGSVQLLLEASIEEAEEEEEAGLFYVPRCKASPAHPDSETRGRPHSSHTPAVPSPLSHTSAINHAATS